MIEHTKLHIPHGHRSLVVRPALMSKLNEGMKARLTCITAPAGYGKSTALGEWAKQCGYPAAWVSLDKQDNDWVRYWSYIIASLEAQFPGFGASVLPLVHKGPAVSNEPAMDALLKELRAAPECVILLDDYYFIGFEPVHRSMHYLLKHLPSHTHFYIASRNDPALLMTGTGNIETIHRISMQDLSFELDEGLTYFQVSAGLNLTREQATQLYHLTEGWVSGLQLAAISLEHSVNIAETIELIQEGHEAISDYLLKEVFSHLPKPVQLFLLETSILSRMNHALCEAVTGQPDCRERLASLEKLNLFIIPLDNQGDWYRYHHLLADFLQQKLAEAAPESVITLHLLAARWWEEFGFEEEAVEHYLKAKQYEAAVRLIEKNLMYLLQSRSVVLNRWLSVVPDTYLTGKPMVEMFYSLALLGVGNWEAAFQRISSAEATYPLLKDQLSEKDYRQAMGNLYFLCSIAAYLQKDLVRMSGYFEQMEQYMPEGSFFQSMGRNRYQGYDAFDDHLVYINDLHYAEVSLLKWIEVWEPKPYYPFVGFLMVSYSKLLYEWNRLGEADYYVHKALNRKDIDPYARILIHLTVSAVRIHQAKGDFSGAFGLLDKLVKRMDSPDHSLFMKRIEAERAWLALQNGEIAAARSWLDTCDMAYTDKVSANLVSEHLILARVLAACGQAEEALQLLECLYQLLVEENRERGQIQVLILQAVIMEESGRREASLASLRVALLLAEPQRYIRSFIDEGAVMKELLAECLLQERRCNKTANEAGAITDYIGMLLKALESGNGQAAADTQYQPYAY